jgi:hypothetical protein
MKYFYLTDQMSLFIKSKIFAYQIKNICLSNQKYLNNEEKHT